VRMMTPNFWHKLLNNIKKMSKSASESRKSKMRLKRHSDSMKLSNKRKSVSKNSKRNMMLR
jgi:hypothetical protein